MFRKIFILPYLSFVFVINTNGQHKIAPNEFSIRSNLSFWDSILVKITVEGKTIFNDSLLNKQIELKGKTNRTKEAFLEIKKGHLTITIPFYVEPGQITIKDFGKYYTYFKISGTIQNDLKIACYKQLDSALPFKLLTDQKITQAQYEEKKRSWATQYISHNRNSITDIGIYRDFFLNAEIADSEKIDVFNLLSNQIKSSYGGELLSKEIDVIKKTEIGNLSPLFKLNDTGGRVFFLKQFRGKYVLIDFWASWCGPCRAQIPALKTVFEKYKTKKFEILAISLDTDRDRWINAINDEHFDWIQLSDLKGWTSPVMQSYHITAIPANLLIDPGGKIIAKNLEPPELDKKLFSIF